jgi:RNA polymerase sigma-70 factor (ECF subfamily)
MARVEDEDLDRLYREHDERLWRAVFAFAGDREVASDPVAEDFAQCLRRGEAVREPGRWIWRAAFRIAGGELQNRRRRRALMPDQEAGSYGIPERVLDALGRISPRQRAAVVLHDYVGYSTKEVEEVLGSTVATVRVHLSQGRRRLRALLQVSDG